MRLGAVRFIFRDLRLEMCLSELCPSENRHGATCLNIDYLIVNQLHIFFNGEPLVPGGSTCLK